MVCIACEEGFYPVYSYEGGSSSTPIIPYMIS